MKYLKLFESVDYFKELEEKTGIGVIKPEIDDLFIDLKEPDGTIQVLIWMNLLKIVLI